MAVKITCVNKDNGNHYDPHEAITFLGWTNEKTRASGRSSLADIVNFLERQGGQAYVKDRFGNIAYLVVKVSQYGNKYVKTIPDGKMTDNLLNLPECPI
jgi:hypothetical protein